MSRPSGGERAWTRKALTPLKSSFGERQWKTLKNIDMPPPSPPGDYRPAASTRAGDPVRLYESVHAQVLEALLVVADVVPELVPERLPHLLGELGGGAGGVLVRAAEDIDARAQAPWRRGQAIAARGADEQAE